MATIRDLSANISPDVWMLQEHWATPNNLCKFDMFTEYCSFGNSVLTTCVESGIARGRPFGGIMILIKNALREFTQTVFCKALCNC